ncbi:TMEM165/GDT1 family protein [Rivularia sp. UHCC 0363]|uniref:TMEM165/GDT1 family protein n=1 Tax=Rivularia sp. UHCC 0363 TaxID=3110244 RepID=UPI002B210AD8|nr:TMEM165/GDT1 family protein [Rivularia sp. UHCC 0363]MEA5597477.1 TMEM165/GDT1 family protein [Rivularia sp. UHCC 0363]
MPTTLTAFTAGLLLITVSELGDKTFFITAILAMRHPHRPVLIGAISALAAMTLLSVLLGQVAMLLPPVYVQWAEAILFLGFGLKLIYAAQSMSDQPAVAEQVEALKVVTAAEAKLPKRHEPGIIMETFGLVFVGEWGDRTQIATIALAAANPPVGVALGAILGHAICAVLAIACGRMLCGRISERMITLLGGGLFLIFAVVGFYRLR